MNNQRVSNREKMGEVMQHLVKLKRVVIHFDPRPESVRVPSHLKDELATDLSVCFGVPGQELVCDAAGLRGEFLLEDGKVHRCDVPWDSVFSFWLEGETVINVWPQEAPAELQKQFLGLRPQPVPARPHLRLVEDPN